MSRLKETKTKIPVLGLWSACLITATESNEGLENCNPNLILIDAIVMPTGL